MLAIVATMLPQAASPGETAWRACVDRTTTNADRAQCGGTWIAHADANLNAEWRQLMAPVSGSTKADLVTEQRAWLGYRELACAFYGNGDWGREGQVLHYPACVAGVIERRMRELADHRKFVTRK